MTKRILWIDYAKCFGIILVVLGHALQGVLVSRNLSNTSGIVVMRDFVYGFHMPMYFILSGIFAERWGNRTVKVAISQKIRTIVIPYFVWTIITGSAMQLVSKYTNNGLGIKNVILSPIIPFSEYWFLYTLFFIFILYLFLNKINIPKKYILLLSVILLGLSSYLGDVKILGGISKYFVYFILGTYLRKGIPYIRSTRFVYIVIGMVMVNMIYLSKFELDDFQLVVIKLITAVIGSVFVFKICLMLDTKKEIKIMSNIGKASMGIFVIHLLPLSGARIFLEKILWIQSSWTLVIISFIIAILSSYLVFLFLKKYSLGRIAMGEK